VSSPVSIHEALILISLVVAGLGSVIPAYRQQGSCSFSVAIEYGVDSFVLEAAANGLSQVNVVSILGVAVHVEYQHVYTGSGIYVGNAVRIRLCDSPLGSRHSTYEVEFASTECGQLSVCIGDELGAPALDVSLFVNVRLGAVAFVSLEVHTIVIIVQD
jgi:hypothetical protein